MSKNIDKRYNVSDISIQFDNYLRRKGLSRISRKNYLADVRLFLKWSLSNATTQEFCLDNIISFKNYMEISNLPVTSINRSLSSLRAFGDLLVQNQALFNNPARMVSNVSAPQVRNHGALIDEFSHIHALSKSEIALLQEFLEGTI